MSANEANQNNGDRINQDISINKLYTLILEANEKQTKELKSEIQTNLKTVTNKIDNINQELENLKTKNLNLERKSRKNNIVIFGIDDTQTNHNQLSNTLKLLNELLATNIKEEDINNIYTLGNRNNSPVILEFVSFLKKITLFQSPEKLRNLKSRGISIANDLCPEDRENRKILKKHLNHAKAQNLEASIKGFRLQIGNNLYTVEQLKKIEKNSEIDIESSEESEIDRSSEGEEDEKENKTQELKEHPGSSITESAEEKRPLVQKINITSKTKRCKVYKYSPKKHRKIRVTRSQIKEKK